MASLNSYKFGDFIIRKQIRFKFLTLKLVQGFHLSVSLSCYIFENSIFVCVCGGGHYYVKKI